jgi:Tfp pilus assembly protein PilX
LKGLETFNNSLSVIGKEGQVMFKKSYNTQQGSVLIIALIILIVLTFTASTSLMNSVTNIKIGSNYSKSIGVFNLAEEGIAKAKLLLKNTADFDTLLNTSTYPGNIIIPTVTSTEGTYSVKAVNNTMGANPDTGGATNDTDQILVVTATAYGKIGTKVEIEAYLGRPTSISFPPSPAGTGGGAVGLCGSGPNINITKGLVSGYDWDPPASFSCSGVSCVGTQKVPASGTYGIVLDSNVNPADRITTSEEGKMEGFLGDWAVNSNLDCSSWLNLSSQLAELGAGPSVNILTGTSITGNTTLGTRANPKVTIINGSGSTFSFKGTVDGAGVIVVVSDTSLSFDSTTHFEGVVIVLGNNAALSVKGGNADIFGYFVVNSAVIDIAPELDINGNKATVKYSTSAIATAMNAINSAYSGGGGSEGQIFVYSWSERY